MRKTWWLCLWHPAFSIQRLTYYKATQQKQVQVVNYDISQWYCRDEWRATHMNFCQGLAAISTFSWTERAPCDGSDIGLVVTFSCWAFIWSYTINCAITLYSLMPRYHLLKEKDLLIIARLRGCPRSTVITHWFKNQDCWLGTTIE